MNVGGDQNIPVDRDKSGETGSRIALPLERLTSKTRKDTQDVGTMVIFGDLNSDNLHYLIVYQGVRSLRMCLQKFGRYKAG